MSGAAVLATKAALRSGVGLARVLTPACNRVVLQTSVPEAIVSVYDEPQELTEYARADALVLGCGLGTSELSRAALRGMLDACPCDGTVPAVLDADGLNLLAVEPELWKTSLLTAPDKQVVITPHPAEMSRLSGLSVAEILSDPVSVAADFARERGVTVVLKDAHTVVASPEGRIFLCAAGNAGMAKGGSGDALAGIIGALLAQSRHRPGRDLTAAEVAAAGVYLHARAGDLTAEVLGEYGMLASDLIERIPLVCKEFSDSRTRLYF
jgi:NAD(P)H-hydrate epimerase